MFSKQLLTDTNNLKKELAQSYIAIENALDEDFANQLRNELLKSQQWKSRNFTIGKFNYKRKEIRLESPDAPPAIQRLYEYLRSPQIQQWASEISDKHIDNFIGAATIFSKDDHISEHNDYFTYEEPGKPRQSRTLTFNYYLSKKWNPENGGNFVWKSPHAVVHNTFNTLILFKPGPLTHHWVEPVTANTEESRLSITGWYTSYIDKKKFKLNI